MTDAPDAPDAAAEIDVSIPHLDDDAREAAQERQQHLTKPPGSLGRLETMAADIAAMQATPQPAVDPAVVATLAADHGVASEGVSAYPQSVTGAMVEAVDAGGAAISALAAAGDIETLVVDMGIAGDVPDGVIDAHVADGTANMADGPAMTAAQARESIRNGQRVVADHAADAGIVGLGEMGIGNTTASAAITALLTDRSVAAVTGHGTGIDEATRQRKIETIEHAIAVSEPDPDDPLDVLRCVGGFEIGGLVGVTLEAASRRVPVVVDGFIASAAALLAVEIEPRVADYLLGSHASVEPGHAAQLDALGIKPCFDYGMRLGEGTGAALAIGIYRAACTAHTEMATFEEAGIKPE
ncbi:nicotinate-nucleotide--dimethylbenzimidazole phosphoribosyltransferase [Halonotius terrestris]|uniref:Nicotinate-nucleotide--dimethylbenzimidazole phosphoribosyltransferase n=1 Tax=Halonotius terrestris TaxID=2487750 RepID=A0A8J8PBT8_9EURY|nr:nicotinate-nucleotide--dimethylbenzimidazole phosphoribosyltransferase [Halonotius terrestris]TQQ81137.1 nicotinate-nucleotide--dimethylbenzimidazole phosphoribosyltransferase [Halonotius terrestris]